MDIIQVLKQIFRFPQTIAEAMRARQRRIILNDMEAERLDRIRNPSKYRFK